MPDVQHAFFDDRELKGSATHYRIFENRINHFDPTDSRTYKQRYILNNTYGDGNNGSPVFIFLSGEATMEFFGFQEVQAKNAADKFGALYINLEHRYYGLSLPFSTFSTDNMKYLSSEQALADAANFIQTFNRTLENPGPWVVFGCSYSGALSAWFRLKYPHLVVASVAPSGPVLAQLNYTSYLGLFQEVAPAECVDVTRVAVKEIAGLIRTDQGRQKLEKDFNMCQPLAEEDDYYFLWSISLTLGGSNQMDNPPEWPLNQSCSVMTQSPDFVSNWGQLFSQTSCNNFSEEHFINFLRDESPGMGRSWVWQKCTEFGFFKSSYKGTSIFFDSLNVEHLVGYCEQVFDIPNMAPNTDWTNANYGGMNIQSTQTMFTNGLIDPWHLLSVYTDPAPPSRVEHTEYEAGHCATLIAATDEDPASLTQSRETVFQFLERVLYK
eukprot:CAMPEP_0119132090 /NCGR_PEP_ID=MMETSP1310-20130426/11419_1 /TAXON_ID=464262 /ORGANISM="Genus nov. species nov., Strain RCC2339" /LENGTH=437 /DNA_ID=CAMNT_0007122703 /DNA_START=153 /DNA_END=1466 /DNA_ORIENTATION=+